MKTSFLIIFAIGIIGFAAIPYSYASRQHILLLQFFSGLPPFLVSRSSIHSVTSGSPVIGWTLLNCLNLESSGSSGSTSLSLVLRILFSPFIILTYLYIVSRDTPRTLAVSVTVSGYGLEPVPYSMEWISLII